MREVIQEVSDTAFWVAHYRAIETKRPDALFKDPYAQALVGDRAASIESINSDATKWTRWTVIMRTYIIDRLIQQLVTEGNTVFLNLGAGLDSRPYRMNLGPEVHWLELDFPHVIKFKTEALKAFEPDCQLTRIACDLSLRPERQRIFAEIATKYKNVVILTEGLLPYLTQQQGAELSEDLTRHSCFNRWICEYISPKSYRYLKDPKRMKALKNAPFQFYPDDWIGFFETRGWKLAQTHYYTEVSENLGRPTPLPGFFKILELFLGQKWATPFKRMSGFLLLSR